MPHYSWELFRLICKGELLPGYQYALRPLSGYGLFAVDGGGRSRQGVILATTDDLTKKSYEKFTLLLQEDGPTLCRHRPAITSPPSAAAALALTSTVP